MELFKVPWFVLFHKESIMKDYPSIPRATGHHIIRAKAKTQLWLDRILARYGVEAGMKIINS